MLKLIFISMLFIGCVSRTHCQKYCDSKKLSVSGEANNKCSCYESREAFWAEPMCKQWSK